MATIEEVQEMVTAAKESIGMVMADELQAVFDRWQTVMGLPAPPAPGTHITIPVIYTGTQSKGISSLDLFLTIPLDKITFLDVGGSSPNEVIFLTQKNFKVPGEPKIVGYSSRNCGPAPRTVFTILAQQDAPVVSSDFTWEKVLMGTKGVGEGPGVAELIFNNDGTLLCIEVKEV